MKTSTAKHLLVIGLNWPEPKSSAAGSRMMQILRAFLKNNWSITFASSAQVTDFSEDLKALDISTLRINPNDSLVFSLFEKLNPTVVLFDRFMIEEQFGWRIAEACPDAIRVLDTEDLHFLRKARETATKQGRKVTCQDLFNHTAKREIAAMLRCDLSLIISEFEQELLLNCFELKKRQLLYIPFLLGKVEEEVVAHLCSFEQRKNFMFIGNFLHQPNYDAVLYLKTEIWPLIKKKLPEVELHIYGAYTPQKVKQLERKSEGFLIKGRAENVGEVMQNSRILIAPLRFGAGLKGKIFDAMQNGTPIITTSVGAEGIPGKLPFSGYVVDRPSKIAEAAVTCYNDAKKWKDAQTNGVKIINSRFARQIYITQLFETLEQIELDLLGHRSGNFVGQMMMHHRMQSTKFMARWIETKNKFNKKIH